MPGSVSVGGPHRSVRIAAPSELNAIAAHKDMYLFSGIVFLIAGLLIVMTGPGLMRLFRGPKGVTVGQVAGTLLMTGGTVTAGWYALGAAEYEMVNHTGLDRQALATFLHKANDGSSILPLVILFMVGIVIGSILFAVATWRTRVAPAWAAVGILAGGFLRARRADGASVTNARRIAPILCAPDL